MISIGLCSFSDAGSTAQERENWKHRSGCRKHRSRVKTATPYSCSYFYIATAYYMLKVNASRTHMAAASRIPESNGKSKRKKNRLLYLQNTRCQRHPPSSISCKHVSFLRCREGEGQWWPHDSTCSPAWTQLSNNHISCRNNSRFQMLFYRWCRFPKNKPQRQWKKWKMSRSQLLVAESKSIQYSAHWRYYGEEWM